MNKNIELITQIKAIMKGKGLMQGYVAEKAGFTKRQFSDMLNGRKLILAEHIPHIATALGVRIADIYEDTETKN